MSNSARRYGAGVGPREWLAVRMDEYRTLRTEVLDSIRNQHQTLLYSFSILGLLAVAAAQVWKEKVVAGGLLFAGLPLLADMLVLVWLGEVERMMRVGSYISRLEHSINKYFPSDCLGWETYLRGRRGRQMSVNYQAVIATFLGMAVGAVLAGDVAVSQDAAFCIASMSKCRLVIAPAVTTVVQLLLSASIAYWIWRRAQILHAYSVIEGDGD